MHSHADDRCILDLSNLAPDEAKILDALFDRMVASYLKSGLDEMGYRAWKRLSTTTYTSDRHGPRFVNVHLNDKSSDPFMASANQPMPVGSIVVKDSVSAIESGGISRGPLFNHGENATRFRIRI